MNQKRISSLNESKNKRYGLLIGTNQTILIHLFAFHTYLYTLQDIFPL